MGEPAAGGRGNPEGDVANALLEKAIPQDDPKQAGWAAPATQTEAPGGYGTPIVREGAMTMGGVASATGVLFVILLAFGAWGWTLVTPGPEGQFDFPNWLFLPIIGAAVVAVIAFVKPPLARFLAPLYAAAEGVAL